MSHPPLSLGRAARIVALALPLAALLMMYMAVTAHADVICVPNDAVDGSCTAGQSEATIQAAINAAVTGVDTVRVGPGTYNENLTLGKNIPLLGAQNDRSLPPNKFLATWCCRTSGGDEKERTGIVQELAAGGSLVLSSIWQRLQQ